ncbi:MAG: dUTP diphosphatase [Brevinema sp.]
MTVKIKKLHSSATLPAYQSEGASGADLYAMLDAAKELAEGEIFAVPTGLSVEIPKGYEMQIRARSGLGAKGLIIPNAPGTIDSDYRGEIKVLVLNLSGKPFIIEPQMRIAQAVIAPVERAVFEEMQDLTSTQRGEGGFGSTGLK